MAGGPGKEQWGAGADPAGRQAKPRHHPRSADPGHGEDDPTGALPGDAGQELHGTGPLQVC